MHGENMTKPELLDTKPAADYIDVKPHTLEIWRSTGRYKIPFVRVGRLVKYLRTDLDAWLYARTVYGQTAQTGAEAL